MSHRSNGLVNRQQAADFATPVDPTGDDIVLQFFTEVLGLKSLHWGYWEKDEALTLENLKEAQLNFTKVMADMIPDSVETILDVGCGIGDNANYLAEQGYRLTCISPDVNHEAALQQIVNGQIEFHRSPLEEFIPRGQFDLALMSESSNYFDADVGFSKLRDHLRDGGYILSASLFRRENNGYYINFHVERDWIATAERYSFEIVERKDITENAAPTAAFAGNILNSYGLPSLNMFAKYVRKSKGWKAKVASFLLDSRLDHLTQYFSKGYGHQMSNADLFREHASYIFYLLKKSS